MITVGSVNVFFLLLAMSLVILAGRSDATGGNAWRLATACVLDPLAPAPFPPSDALTSLKFYLTNESLVPAKAVGTIVIDRSLVLRFFEQVIPFTVMIFTTMNEFERRPA